jgi:hypothetical protein
VKCENRQLHVPSLCAHSVPHLTLHPLCCLSSHQIRFQAPVPVAARVLLPALAFQFAPASEIRSRLLLWLSEKAKAPSSIIKSPIDHPSIQSAHRLSPPPRPSYSSLLALRALQIIFSSPPPPPRRRRRICIFTPRDTYARIIEVIAAAVPLLVAVAPLSLAHL